MEHLHFILPSEIKIKIKVNRYARNFKFCNFQFHFRIPFRKRAHFVGKKTTCIQSNFNGSNIFWKLFQDIGSVSH